MLVVMLNGNPPDTHAAWSSACHIQCAPVFADAHLIDAFSMGSAPDRGLASAGHKASAGSLLAKSEDECKPDGLYRVQMSIQNTNVNAG